MKNQDEMGRRAINLTIEKVLIDKLQALADRNNISKSRMIEYLIKDAYKNRGEVSYKITRDKVDRIDRDANRTPNSWRP